MPIRELNRAADAVKLDLYDHAMAVVECIEALQMIAQAGNDQALLRELTDLHGTMVRLTARSHKLALRPITTHDESPATDDDGTPSLPQWEER